MVASIVCIVTAIYADSLSSLLVFVHAFFCRAAEQLNSCPCGAFPLNFAPFPKLIHSVVHTYIDSDVPVSLADACLVRMSETTVYHTKA